MTTTHILVVIIGLLAVLDVVSTRRALRRPGNHEANPIIARLMRLGPVWIVIKLAVTAVAVWMAAASPLLLAGIALIYAMIVARNFRLARR